MNELLPAVEINPPGTPRASVIWLHGLGADGYDFAGIVPELRLDPALGIRFVLPHAPHMPVTINSGYVMRAWYDIRGADLREGEDDAGIRASAAAVEQLITREIALGVPARRIILAGFSQGGAIVLHTGLRYPERLGGLLALSTYLPLADAAAAEHHAPSLATPIMMAHGTTDTIVPWTAGCQSRDLLRSLGYRVEWHEYPMAHSVCTEEVGDIANWLRAVLHNSESTA